MTDAYRYRIHLGPAHRRGEFRATLDVTITVAALVEGGEMDCVRLQSTKAAEKLLGDDARALRVTRVQREERGGEWRDLRWPLPMPSSVNDLVFSAAGELLTNVVPTWPE